MLKKIILIQIFFISIYPQTNLILPHDFPNYTIFEGANIHDGDIFFSSSSSFPANKRNYLIITNNIGELKYFKKLNYGANDFKLQKNGLLSYSTRINSSGDMIAAVTMDSTFTELDSLQVTDPYRTDNHEFLILENGNYFLLGKIYKYIDLSEYGGYESARIQGCVIQEFNDNNELIFEWNSFDYYQVEDVVHISLTLPQIDYVHANSIDIDNDGNIILSARHLCEITKIDRISGQIIWRLGGKNNEFTFTDYIFNGHIIPQPFCQQHDARILDNGNLTFFDNGNDKDTFYSNGKKYSRLVEYSIDEINKVAELVWEYTDTTNYSRWLGNFQTLNNGNKFSVWNSDIDSLPTVIQEIKPDCTLAMKIEMPIIVDGNNNKAGDYVYRAFKFDWTGKPIRPTLWSDTLNNKFSLNFIHFGNTDIEKYFIYAGTNFNNLNIIDSTESNRYTFNILAYRLDKVYAISSKKQNGESPISNQITYTNLSLSSNGDINYDGKLDIFDLVFIIDVVNRDTPATNLADINMDNIVDIVDINNMLRFFSY